MLAQSFLHRANRNKTGDAAGQHTSFMLNRPRLLRGRIHILPLCSCMRVREETLEYCLLAVPDRLVEEDQLEHWSLMIPTDLKRPMLVAHVKNTSAKCDIPASRGS